MKVVDLTGERFGRLTVLRRMKNQVAISGQQYAMWLCRCDCGVEVIARGANLRSGLTKSCGCLRANRASDRMKAAWAALRREEEREKLQ